MDISDCIAICGIAISLIISVVNLMYNSKVIRDSLKPDIHVYLDYLASNSIQYLVIKNFGKTGTKIIKFNHNITDDMLFESMDKKDANFIYDVLNKISNLYLAPNQTYCIPYPYKKLEFKEKSKKVIEIKLFYKYGYKTVKKNFNIDLSIPVIILGNNMSVNERLNSK
ncbi:MAG: hypothetical protein K2F59_06260 [Eubacteriales bacterium]|nr:hypothetical protein [Eubacteriales bacterium]